MRTKKKQSRVISSVRVHYSLISLIAVTKINGECSYSSFTS